MKTALRTQLIFLLFVASGFAGLIYEGIWARYLKLMLGHSAFGQILTLCIYMGGLGLGSFIAGRMLPYIRRPFLAYAIVELVVGFGGLLYHPIFVRMHDWLLYSPFAASLSPDTLTLLKVTLGAGITLPWSIMLGLTFPLVTAGIMALDKDAGRRGLPLLYFTNSLGACVGILVASFILLPRFGTHGSLIWAAGMNFVLAIAFALTQWGMPTLSNHGEAEDSVTPAQPPIENQPDEEVPNRGSGLILPLLIIAGLTGFNSFIYEVAWIRLLSLILGSSTHSFDLMISAFILGLAGGSLFVRRFMNGRNTLRMLVHAQLWMGVAAATTLITYSWIFSASNHLNLILLRSAESYPFHSVIKYIFCVFLMAPASFFAGMTLPLITYHLCQATKRTAYTGFVYGWNTLGGILGAALGGLILLPAMQLSKTIWLGAFLDVLLGVAIVVIYSQRKLYLPATLALLFLMFTATLEMRPRILAQGAFRSWRSNDYSEQVFMRHGITASISIHRFDQTIVLKTNGKSDASISTDTTDRDSHDNRTQAMLAWLPLSALPAKPYHAAIVGMGSGMTTHYLLADSLVQSVDVFEIEKEVYNLAKQHFYPLNRRGFDSTRVRYRMQDARVGIAHAQYPYSLIISEPSNPWVSGVSSLFTEEFYQIVRNRMAPDGVLAQWLHLYEIHDDLIGSVLKAISGAFEYFEVFQIPNMNDIIILASPQPINLHPERLTQDSLVSDLEELEMRPDNIGNFLSLGSQDTYLPLLANTPVNSDFLPVLDNGAEEAFYTKRNSWLDQLFVPSPVGLTSLWDTLVRPNTSCLDASDVPTLKMVQDTGITELIRTSLNYLIGFRVKERTNNWRKSCTSEDYYLFQHILDSSLSLYPDDFNARLFRMELELSQGDTTHLREDLTHIVSAESLTREYSLPTVMGSIVLGDTLIFNLAMDLLLPRYSIPEPWVENALRVGFKYRNP